MYQFYYSKELDHFPQGSCNDNIFNHFNIEAVRPTMWEEHCLECSAPLCYQNCLHYVKRSDGRCKRFDNGFLIINDKNGCCGQRVHIKFRKWANMMTIVFPSMLPIPEYRRLTEKNQALGERLKWIVNSNFPVQAKWECIRTIEFLRRRKMRKMSAGATPNAFVFHGYSYEDVAYNLILEVYDDHIPLFRTALRIAPGENLFVLKGDDLSEECWKPNHLIKVYPENNLEAEIDLLWCDFVKGREVTADHPADKVKCVVWDLDNTLWDGTLVETEYSADLKLRDGVLTLIRELDQRGIVQSIASKNDFDAAWPVIEHLGLADYFLYPQIHWQAKSSSMKEIARQLNIGLDSLALIDDSVFERQQVVSVCPQVRVYDINAIQSLLYLPEFDVLVTEESKLRREMYRAEAKRNVLREQANEDTVAFLKKCQLRIDLFQPKTETEFSRCYELVVRTNQLNMSGKKYTPEEFKKVLQREDCCNFAFSCSDIFGSYGIVGFGQYRVEDQKLFFTEFAMSCRVAGKYVESALFAALLSITQCRRGYFYIIKTKKNALLRRTLENIGFQATKETDVNIEYFFEQKLMNNEIVSVAIRDAEE